MCGEACHGAHSGRRVELNAFTSADFIRWIEAKLKANGIKKVVPDAKTLEVAYRRAVQIEVVREQLTAIVQKGKRGGRTDGHSQGPHSNGPQGVQSRSRPAVGPGGRRPGRGKL